MSANRSAGAVVIVGKDGKAAWEKVYDIAEQSDVNDVLEALKPLA